MNHLSEIEFSKFEDRKRARLINSLSGFKSANLIGTQNKDGATNLSIVSSVFHLGASPALVGLIIRPDTVRRDTLENIRETKVFTINHVNNDIVIESHQTSARYRPEQSEFQECGLTVQYLKNFKAPFVHESKIKIALEFKREQRIEENGTILLIGQIKDIYFPEDCLENDGKLNIEKAGTICVSGLDNYHSTESIGRLSYAKPDRKLEWI
ncbi:MAG: flavin oxidoreductase [Oligoflexia bacterium]|nr:flavin oxidoreductase [Oligoflexia bacterium]